MDIATRLQEIDKYANVTPDDRDACLTAWGMALSDVMCDYPPLHVWPDQIPPITQGDATDAEIAALLKRLDMRDFGQLAEVIADQLIRAYANELSVELSNP